jgi:flagellar FliL protein
MSDAASDGSEKPSKSIKKPLIFGLLLAVAGGAAGYLGGARMWQGEPDSSEPVAQKDLPAALQGITFVPIEPMIVSLGSGQSARHLRFTAQIEVPEQYQTDVIQLMPRILDMLNGYLRTIEAEDLERNFALARLRSHILSRLYAITGENRVSDVLITEFVLN